MRIKIITKRQDQEDRFRRVEARLRSVVDVQDRHHLHHIDQVASVDMILGLGKRVDALEAPLPWPDQEAEQLVTGYIDTGQTREEFVVVLADVLRRRSER